MRRRLLRRCRTLGLGALLPLALVPAATAAQAPVLSVTPGRETEVRTAPGKIVTAPFQLQSSSPDSLRLLPEVATPEGWRVMSGTAEMRVAPGASTLWLVSVSVPGSAEAGVHLVPLRVRRAGGELLYEDTLRLTVTEQPKVQLRLLSAPGYAVAGDTVSIRYLVQNQGNAPAEFRLWLGVQGGLRTDEGETSLSLAPGASSERSVVLRAAALEQSQTARVRVRATSAGRAEVGDSISAEMVVVPTTRRARGAYYGVPARLRMRAAEGAHAPVLGELTGGGQLLDGRGPEVSFHLRSVGGTDPLMQERDFYALSVRSSSYALQLGDQVFEQSTLAGGMRGGFGAGGAVRRGAITAGGFATTPRGASVEPGQQSAFASYRLGEQEVTTRLSRLAGSGADDGGSLATLDWNARPLPGAQLSVGYGTGRSANGRGSGYSADLRGDHRWLKYDLAHRAGDEALPGPYRGVRTSSASVGLAPASWISLTGSAGRYRQQGGSVPFTYKSSGSSRSLSVDLAGIVGTEYRSSESLTGLGEDDLRQWEEALRVRASLRLGPLSLWGAVEAGERSSLSTGRAVRYADLTAMPSLTLGSAMLSVYARNVRQRDREPVPDEGWSLGVNLSSQVVDGLRLSLAGSDNAPAMAGRAREQRLEGRVEQALPGGHLLSLRAQAMRGSMQIDDGRTLSIEYSIPLKMRTGKANAPDRVVGRVTDGETGAGLGGVVVRLQDQFVVSDRAGYVVFSQVRPGAHPLNVTRSRDAGQVAIGDSLVEVGEGVAARPFHLRMVHGAHLRGSVRLLARGTSNGPGPDGFTEGGGLQNVVLLLESATDTVFLVTDPHGNFDAGRIRPGRWTISHVGGGLPALYEFERPRTEFMVAAGESRELRLTVRPRHRDIQMIASGEVLVMNVPSTREKRVIKAEPIAGTVTEVAMGGARVKPTLRRVKRAEEMVVAAAASPAPRPAQSWHLRTPPAALRLAATVGAAGPAGENGRFSPGRSAAPAASLAVALAPARRSRSGPAALPREVVAMLGARRQGEDDPPERIPIREGPVPWRPPQQGERVPWDPLAGAGRAPPGWMLQHDPPPARAGPG